MRITFLCSSLEPGRDGVGDYTRVLARECIRLGHHCALIALNDRHLPVGTEVETDDAGLRTLRLAPGIPWERRIRRAAALVTEFDPDWISLQFVAYGYHQKGIVAALAGRLPRVIGSRRLQVMMHELWIGGGPQSSLKERCIGRVQRLFVLRLLKVLRPSVLHTNLPIHVELLSAAGLRAELLPLFGNIPVADANEAVDLNQWLRRGGLSATGLTREKALIGGFFGAFYPEWNPEPLFTYLQAAASARGQRLCLIAAGRLGRYGEQVWADLTARYGERICMVKAGELSPRELSQLFRLLDFGLPASPWHLIGKSSSAASMLDHGVPLILVPDPHAGFRGELATGGPPGLIHRCDGQLESKLMAGLQKCPPSSSCTRIAGAFLARLNQAAGRTQRDDDKCTASR